jgi:YD repeat-containing protein
MFKKILFVAPLLLYSKLLFSQTDPVFNVPSPNSQALQIFGTFPQSSYTGVPAISVPLYTIKYKNISIPIGLSYNTNLVKPDSHPGWVGLGWNLSAGGAITRVVNGQPDDMTLYNGWDGQTCGDIETGLYYHFSDLSGSSWNSYENMKNATNDWYSYYQNYKDNKGNSVYWAYEHNPHTVKDYEPDQFSFNFLGLSGKFYLDETGNWKVQSDQNLKVKVSTVFTQCTVAGYPGLFGQPGFSQFTITDNQGIQYVFGGVGDNSIEYSNTLFTQDEVPYVAQTWNLTKIILPGSETITFSYDRGPLIIALSPQSYNTLQANNPLGTFNAGSGIELMGSVIVPSYLKSISTSSQTVNFVHSPTTELPYDNASLSDEYNLYIIKKQQYQAQVEAYNNNPGTYDDVDSFIQLSMLTDLPSLASAVWHKLDRIDVTDGNNVVYESFDFTYTNSATERLKLLKVANSSTLPGQPNGGIYQFSYNTTHMLPPYLSLLADYWGNYNGTTPDFSSAANFNASRNPNFTYEMAEVLQKITYPTGGYSIYTFEPHDYSKSVNDPAYSPLTINTSNSTAGGLRIKTIVNYDSNGTKTDSNNYYYDVNHFGSGSHLSSGVANSVKNFEAYSYNNNNTGPVNVAYFVPNFPGSQIEDGAGIGYSEVTRQYSDGSYTVTKFSNFDNGTNGEYMDTDVAAEMGSGAYALAAPPNLFYHAFTSHAFERGRILEEQIYSAAGGTPLVDNVYTYQRLNATNNFVRAINPSFKININAYNNPANLPGSTIWGEAFSSYAYEFLTYPYLLSSKTTTTQENPAATPITQTFSYSYDPVYLNIKTTTTQNSKGQTEEEDAYFPSDLVALGQDITGVYGGMINANMTGIQVQKIKKLDSVQQTEESFDYSNPSAGIFVPKSRSLQVQSNAAEKINQYLNYDAQGNLLCEARPNGESISYQWGYQNQFPVAKIENAANTLGTSIQSAGNTNTYISLPVGSNQVYQQMVNVWGGSPTVFALAFTGIPASNTVASVNMSVTGPNNYSNNFLLCNSPASSNCSNPNTMTITGLPTGTYMISASYNFSQNLTSNAQVDINYASSTSIQTGIIEFYYNGFEEDLAGVSSPETPHTGTKYGLTNSVAWSPPSNGRMYMISYWYLLNGVWTYSGELPYTGSVSSPYTLISSSGYDDIRILPKDASMTTYTYDPTGGMTSVTDAKGETTYYEYDGFQRLLNIRDKDKNITKHFIYHYQGQ